MSTRLGLLLAAMVLHTGAVEAQDVPFAAATIETCLARTSEPGACIGVGAAACQSEAGLGSAGICLGAENAFWLARIADLEVSLQAGAGARTVRSLRRGVPTPTLPEVADALAQYRRVVCEFRVAQWDGMMTGPEEIDCQMRINAAHALYLSGLVTP